MDFIERLFGVSPDGGSGVTEAIWLVTILAIALVVVLRRAARTGTKP